VKYSVRASLITVILLVAVPMVVGGLPVLATGSSASAEAPSIGHSAPKPAKAGRVKARTVPDSPEYYAAKKRSKRFAGRPVAWPKAANTELSVADAKRVTMGAVSASITGDDEPVGLSVLGHDATKKAGVKGVVVKLTSARPGRGEVHVTTDYSEFLHAYGANWAGRLKVDSYPACFLTTPEVAACAEPTALKTSNNRKSNSITAVTPRESLRGTTVMVLAAAPAASDGTGNFASTPLSNSGTWSVGGSSGDFNWSYPMPVIPANNGPSPTLNLTYSSQSVDGRTSSTNNQSTMLGEGFDLASAYVQRDYASCDDDGNTGKYDYCWAGENLTLVLNGASNDLIKASDGTYRLRSDDGSIVRKLTSTSSYNLDNDKEYWELTAPDGTRYFFGRTKSDGQTGDTGSVWTVPVFGNNSGEPCYAAGSFANSSCTQAWRWNLDYVLDPNGNTMSLWYSKETNHYKMTAGPSTGTTYVRGGRVNRMDYGMRQDETTNDPAPFQVGFAYSIRCQLAASDCDNNTAAGWPDTPNDLTCTGATGTTCTQSSPSFFTRYRLTRVASKVQKASAYSYANTWDFTEHFVTYGTAADGILWLDSIKRTGGYDNGTSNPDIVLPEVEFTPVRMDNRVNSSNDGLDALTRPRMQEIESETGGLTSVFYTPQECTAGSVANQAEDTNLQLCYPQWWTPDLASEHTLSWFHKYLVQKVTQTDTTGLAPDLATSYVYEGNPGWAWDDTRIVPATDRSWSQWRGYGQVQTNTGESGSTRGSQTTLYFRGLNGDKRKSGTPHHASVTASDGTNITDSTPYAGRVFETRTYSEFGGALQTATINTPWMDVTAGNPSATPRFSAFVGTAKEESRTAVVDVGDPWRRRTVTYHHKNLETGNPTGNVTAVSDTGDQAVNDDQTCTAKTYADNTAATSLRRIGFVARTVTWAGLCTGTASDLAPSESAFISETRNLYDGTTAVGTAATRGLVTRVDRVNAYSAGDPQYQVMAQNAYDANGRQISTTVPTASASPTTRTTTTAYTTSADGTVTSVKETVDSVTGGLALATTKVMATELGQPTKVTDPNGRITNLAYDALGRLTEVRRPNRTAAQTPNIKYTYTLSKTAAGIKTSILNPQGNGTVDSVSNFDSLLRQRQTQTASPASGRIVADQLYDSRGLVKRTVGDLVLTGSPSTAIAAYEAINAQAVTDTTYDGLGRATASMFKNGLTTRWTTSTSYGGSNRTTVTPPAGAAPKTSYTNIDGQVTKSTEIGTPNLTTTFDHDARGNLTTIVSPAGTFTYTYDLLGRKVTSNDPDSGTTTTGYTKNDQVKTVTDQRNKSTITVYDRLDRQSLLYEGITADETKRLAAWTYDTTGFKGRLATQTRYVGGLNGDKFTRSYTYTSLYDPDTVTLTVAKGTTPSTLLTGFPASVSFPRTTIYNPDQSVNNSYLPAVILGGQTQLSEESVALGYDNLGMLVSAQGRTGIFRGTTYDSLGRLSTTVVGQGTDPTPQLNLAYNYDPGTSRITQAQAIKTVAANGTTTTTPVSHHTYTYDNAGNPLSDNEQVSQDRQCFRYDDHQRLTNAWTPTNGDCSTNPSQGILGGPAPYWQSWTFDPSTGRRAKQTTVTPTETSEDTYTYTPSTAGPTHQNFADSISRVVNGGAPQIISYGHDDSGNTSARPDPDTSLGQQALTWNAEGKLSSLATGSGGSAKTTQYVYDLDGTLLFHSSPTDATLVADETEVTLDKATSTFSAKRNYTLPGNASAVRGSNTQISFTVTDAHGSGLASLDGATMGPTRRFMTPYGEARGNVPASWPTTRGFLNKLEDKSTGLTSVGAREYDPGIGRFLSVDPILDATSSAQALGYSYSSNNPVAFADPTGLMRLADGGGRAPGYGVLLPQPSIVRLAYTPPPPAPVRQPKKKSGGWLGNAVGGVIGAVGDAVGAAGDAVDAVADAAVDTGEWVVDNRHVITEVVGYIPAVGDIVDLADVIMYMAEGNWGQAGLSALAVIPIVGSPLKSIAKHGDEAIDGFKAVARRADEGGQAAKRADDAGGLADDVVIVRGGTSEVPPPGEVFSGAYGATLDDAGAYVPHGQLRATTAGEIRAGGGRVDVVPEMTRAGNLNTHHVNICLGQGSCSFGPLIPNPVPRSGRIQ